MTLTPIAHQPVRRSRAGRVVAPAAVIGGLAMATLALRLRDPHQNGSWGLCPSAQLGFWCPGCGGLRAVNDLTHGQLDAAFSSNVLVVTLMPLAVFLLARWTLDSWRGVRREPSPRTTPVLVTLTVVAVVFMVVRNLAFGAWLAP